MGSGHVYLNAEDLSDSPSLLKLTNPKLGGGDPLKTLLCSGSFSPLPVVQVRACVHVCVCVRTRVCLCLPPALRFQALTSASGFSHSVLDDSTLRFSCLRGEDVTDYLLVPAAYRWETEVLRETGVTWALRVCVALAHTRALRWLMIQQL